jgi:hypothetical protein
MRLKNIGMTSSCKKILMRVTLLQFKDLLKLEEHQ